ncbi:hypothetical protein D8674_021566 [Pyrus ussuriensis x Pyrus communis]|uniref:Uncharacterized protein n=1 Tax=Pyrus ussuriensis x Pyrus communis TaxID=2448454 RepID=A0A5N5GHY8_9ROSA|nr:hypothetical protein D8674_021566 [Pyrus ussuriensis x Pyrus communis]
MWDEFAESLHATMMEKRQSVLQEFVSQLPPETLIESVIPPRMRVFRSLQTPWIRLSGGGQGSRTYSLFILIIERRGDSFDSRSGQP